MIFIKSPFGKNPPWNETPSTVKKEAQTTNPSLVRAIDNCQQHLEVRDHLDHWWTIWVGFHSDGDGIPVKFKLDHNFTKGYIQLDAEKNIDWTKAYDAVKKAIDDITACAREFNDIYREIAITGGYLDQYLSNKGWCIPYSDYGPPHNGKRPTP